MTKKILIICCLWLILLNSLKAENLEMNLADFATFASQTNKINILIDDSLKNENIIFVVRFQYIICRWFNIVGSGPNQFCQLVSIHYMSLVQGFKK